MITWRLIAATCLLFADLSIARAEESHHTIWEVKGAHNTVYLVGSIHVLKNADHALPAEAVHAYSVSKAVMMELDINNVAGEELQGDSLKFETLPEGQSLADTLGPDLYAQLQAHAMPLGLDTDFMSHFQPWYVAMTLQRLSFAKMGFDANSGVDMQFANLAKADHKPIIGLESVAEQLGIFAHLSLDEQRQYLRATLKESDTTEPELTALITAWQHGDIAKLELILRKGSEQSPDFHRALTSDRNRKWLPKIIKLLNARDNYLVVVGALHMIGPDGLIELLKQRGYRTIQR